MPLRLHLDVDARSAGIQHDVADKRRVLKMVLNPDDGPQRSTLDQLHFIGFVQIPVLLLEIRIDIPGVPLLGLVDEGLQQISAGRVLRPTSVGFCGRQRFRSAALVEQAGHASGLRIDLHADELVLQRVGGGLEQGMNCRCARRPPARNRSCIQATACSIRAEARTVRCGIDAEQLRRRPVFPSASTTSICLRRRRQLRLNLK